MKRVSVKKRFRYELRMWRQLLHCLRWGHKMVWADQPWRQYCWHCLHRYFPLHPTRLDWIRDHIGLLRSDGADF